MSQHVPSGILPEWETGLTQWQNAIAMGRIPQTVLISQEQGKGLFDFARYCAAGLLCEAAQNALACGHCQSCVWFEAETHPDFYVLGEMTASTTIEVIRTLLASLQKTAHQSGRQVVILKGADCLTPAVANALLKTLEEPVGPVTFLLLATRQHQVMQTVRSRCLPIQLAPVTLNMTEMHQKAEKVFVDPKKYPFLPQDLQDWLVEQPQEALIVLYNVVKATLQTHLIQDPGNRASKANALRQSLAFVHDINHARQQCQLPGINKLLLLESLFYQWQKIHCSGE